MPTPDRFRLLAWEVDVRANEVRHAERDEVRRVEPKVMAVLVRLAAEAGAPVTRDALMATVWPEVVVSEDALNRAVSKLRRALGDDPAAPRYVETIPTVGYRLAAPVEPIVGAPIAPAPIVGAASLDASHTPIEVATGTVRAAWRRGALLLMAALGALALAAWLRPAPVSPTVRPLTRAAGAEIHPALAPDGQRVAYALQPRDGASFDLAVQSLDAMTPLRLTDTDADDVHPVWLPDADALAFLRCAEPLACTVWTVAASGGAPRRLTEAPVGRWGLTAAARTFVAIARDSLTGPYRLVGLDAATGARRLLTDPPAGTLGDLYPAASPDGHRVAFVRHDALGEEDLFVTMLDGAPPRRVTADGRGIRGHAWTPDGTGIVYVANRDGVDALWRVYVAGGPPTRLPVAVAGRLRTPTLAAGRLVLAAQQVEIDLQVWEAGAARWQPLATSTAQDTDPDLAADGRLAFVSTRSGAPEVYVDAALSRLGTDAPQRLTSFGGPLVGAVRWSPDGARLAFEAQVEQQASLYVLDAEGGRPRALTDGAGYDVGPRWSPDGRFLTFASNRPDPMTTDTLAAWALWRVAVVGGAPERIGPLGSYVGETLPDGTLVYTREGAPGLWRRASRRAPEERLLFDLAREDWGNWTVIAGGAAVVYPRRTDAGVELRRLALDDRRDTVLTTLDALPGRLQTLAVQPDGQRLVAAQTTRAESDLVLIAPIE